ncbi:MAG: 50S ribosomal protein L24 [Candidatus Kapaibacterium sp.]
MGRIRIKKGDEVVVISGTDKDVKGRVLEVIPATGKVLVEGVNVRRRSWRRGVNPDLPDGGIHEKSLPVDASNVMLLDPESGEPTRIGIRYEIDADGNRRRIRFAKKSGKTIPEQF